MGKTKHCLAYFACSTSTVAHSKYYSNNILLGPYYTPSERLIV